MLPALLARRRWIALALLVTGAGLALYALLLWANNQGIFVYRWHHQRVTTATADQGHAWKIDWINLPANPGRFSTWLFVQENGTPLGLMSYDAEPVRNLGKGRFFLAAEGLLFSASDNSSPLSNGRRYEICVPYYYGIGKIWLLAASGLILLACGLRLRAGTTGDAFATWFTSSRHTLHREAVAFFAVALVVRLMFCHCCLESPRITKDTCQSIQGVPFSDAMMWDDMGETISRGQGVPNFSKSIPGYYSALRPGYGVTLAAIYTWFGVSSLFGVYLNIVAGSLTASLIFLIGAKACCRPAGWIAALFFTVDPKILENNMVLMTESVGTFFFAWSVLELMRALEVGGAGTNLKAGVLLGISNLTRPLTLPALPGYVAILYYYGRKDGRPAAKLTLAFVAGVCISLGPWLVRQYLVHGILTLSDNSAPALYAATSLRHKEWNNDVYREADEHGVPATVKDRYNFFVTEARKNFCADPLYYLQHVLTSAKSVAWLCVCKNSFVPIMAALMLSVCGLAGIAGVQKPYQVVLLLGVLAWGWGLLLQEKYHENLAIVLLVLGLARSLFQPDWRSLGILPLSVVAGLAGVALFGMDQGGGGGRFFIMFEWLIVLLQIMGVVFVAERVRYGFSRVAATSTAAAPETDAPTDYLGKLLAILGRVAALAVAVTAVKLLALNYVVGPPPPAAPRTLSASQKTEILERVAKLPEVAGALAARTTFDTGWKDRVMVRRGKIARHFYCLPQGLWLVHWCPIFRDRDDERTVFYFVDESDIADFPLEMVVFTGRLPEHFLGQDVVVVCAKDYGPRAGGGSKSQEGYVLVPWDAQNNTPCWSQHIVASTLQKTATDKISRLDLRRTDSR